MRALTIVTCLVLGLCLTSCIKMDQSKEVKEASLSSQEVKTSETTESRIPGWHGYNSSEIGPAWDFNEGVISFDPARGKGGDIVSDEEYENFELSLEWKIQDCGNSGIFWNIVETEEFPYPWLTGPEMQVLDNKCHPDAKITTHRAGDLYDMIKTSVENVKPAGEWNSIKIKSMNSEVTFWQNGEQVVQFTMHDENWDKMVADSKFKTMPAFGKAKKGRIGLQDHGDKVWFRNIELKSM